MLKSFQPLPSEAQQGPVSNEVWCGGKGRTRIPEMHCWAQDVLGSHSSWAKTICVTLGKSFSLPWSIILFWRKKKEKGKEIDFQIPKILWPGFFLHNVDSTEHWSQGEGGQINDSMSKIYWEGCIQSPIPSRGYEKSWNLGCNWKIIQRLTKTNSICPFSFVDPSFNIYIGVLIGCEYQSGN